MAGALELGDLWSPFQLKWFLLFYDQGSTEMLQVQLREWQRDWETWPLTFARDLIDQLHCLWSGNLVCFFYRTEVLHCLFFFIPWKCHSVWENLGEFSFSSHYHIRIIYLEGLSRIFYIAFQQGFVYKLYSLYFGGFTPVGLFFSAIHMLEAKTIAIIMFINLYDF